MGIRTSTAPETNVTVSWLSTGPGVTLTFSETNLTASASWAADLMGNYRQAPAGPTSS